MYHTTRSLCILVLLGVGPGHQRIDVLVEVAIGQLGEQIAQISIGFDAVHLACADQAGEAGPVAATLVGSSVMMPGVWVLMRLSRTLFTRFVARQWKLSDRSSTTFAATF